MSTMIPTLTLDTLLTIGAIVTALTAIVAPVAYIIRVEFKLRYMQKDVTKCLDSVTSVESKMNDLMLDVAKWFAPTPSRRQRAIRPLAGRGRK